MELLHKGINKLIRLSLKRDMADYEVEKLKAISLVTICSIITIVLLVTDLFGVKDTFIKNLIVYLSIGFLPTTILYAFNFYISFIFSGAFGSKIGFFSYLLGGNIILFFMGIFLDIILFVCLIILGVALGVPVSIYNMIKRINNSKNIYNDLI